MSFIRLIKAENSFQIKKTCILASFCVFHLYLHLSVYITNHLI